VIFLWLTQRQARRLARETADRAIAARLRKMADADLIPHDEEPRTVLLEDRGDGLTVTAVAYFTEEAADDAAERWWHAMMARHDQAQPHAREKRRARA
jgi:hypothetical protein